jgi:hypothetical protein
MATLVRTWVADAAPVLEAVGAARNRPPDVRARYPASRKL